MSFIYGKEGIITLGEVHLDIRNKNLSKIEDLMVEDIVEGLKISRGISENKEKSKEK